MFVAWGLGALAGDVLLTLAAGSRLSFYVGGAVGEIGFLRGVWMDSSRRLAWLEDYAAAVAATADLPAPASLADGIRFEHVSFAYPGTDRLVLDDVNLELPAGSVVAIVGENGAGKTTLVKLLAKMYEPDRRTHPDRRHRPGAHRRGRVAHAPGRRVPGFLPLRVPGAPHASASATCRGSTTSRRSSPRSAAPAPTMWSCGCAPASTRSSGRRGRRASTSASDNGRSWRWRAASCATGRCVLVLDEPTAALDAETEHALFERYAGAARGQRWHGRITILVSHRFSTVRMADLIVVLDGARVVEVGTHDALMARRGQYAQLYNIQAAAYR